ncbi:MAG: class I SAM-dependent methyltransferase [bacterium]|nr:class I SAM-dependent methyltransferase [bacterium]
MKSPTTRFSDRVDDYIAYRPSYPPAVIDALRNHAGLHGASTIADIGSGTGILTRLLLDAGWQVFAIEPNPEMRLAAEHLLGDHPRFHSVVGMAEDTRLASESIDLITVAQAFHWFRPDETRREFERILRPNGTVALIWNNRKKDSPFLRAYDTLLTTQTAEYASVKHTNITDDEIQAFFGPDGCVLMTCPNEQHLDLSGLTGRAQSSSYVPALDDPAHVPFMRELEALFDQFAADGRVTFEYTTKVHIGRLTATDRRTAG